jgi:hypothetical protein
MNPDKTELTDSVNDTTSATLRKDSPELFGDEPTPSKLADLTEEDLAAVAGEDDGDGAADGAGARERFDADADETPERDDKGRFVPRARVDELTAQRNKEREAREAAERERDELKRAAEERERAEREAAEAKAKEVHDYDADRDALEAKYDANEIEKDEYRREMRKIDKADREQTLRLAEEAAVERIRKENQKAQEQTENEVLAQAKADAEKAREDFLAKPENKAYTTDVNRMAALNAQREIIWVERNGDIGWGELLDEAKKRVEEAFGASKPSEETPAQKTARERRGAQAVATAAASAVPGRPDGGVGARATAEPEDGNDMTTEEWARLPKAERDKRLGKTPASASTR